MTGISQILRKNATKEERHLWYDFLKSYPIQFNRQKVTGDYVVDFYCSKANLVIELDGSQHYENAGLKYEEIRTAYLNDWGRHQMKYKQVSIHGKTN